MQEDLEKSSDDDDNDNDVSDNVIIESNVQPTQQKKNWDDNQSQKVIGGQDSSIQFEDEMENLLKQLQEAKQNQKQKLLSELKNAKCNLDKAFNR